VELQIPHEPVEEVTERRLELGARILVLQEVAQTLDREREVPLNRVLHRADQSEGEDLLEGPLRGE